MRYCASDYIKRYEMRVPHEDYQDKFTRLTQVGFGLGKLSDIVQRDFALWACEQVVTMRQQLNDAQLRAEEHTAKRISEQERLDDYQWKQAANESTIRSLYRDGRKAIEAMDTIIAEHGHKVLLEILAQRPEECGELQQSPATETLAILPEQVDGYLHNRHQANLSSKALEKLDNSKAFARYQEKIQTLSKMLGRFTEEHDTKEFIALIGDVLQKDREYHEMSTRIQHQELQENLARKAAEQDHNSYYDPANTAYLKMSDIEERGHSGDFEKLDSTVAAIIKGIDQKCGIYALYQHCEPLLSAVSTLKEEKSHPEQELLYDAALKFLWKERDIRPLIEDGYDLPECVLEQFKLEQMKGLHIHPVSGVITEEEKQAKQNRIAVLATELDVLQKEEKEYTALTSKVDFYTTQISHATKDNERLDTLLAKDEKKIQELMTSTFKQPEEMLLALGNKDMDLLSHHIEKAKLIRNGIFSVNSKQQEELHKDILRGHIRGYFSNIESRAVSKASIEENESKLAAAEKRLKDFKKISMQFTERTIRIKVLRKSLGIRGRGQGYGQNM